jgi:3-isopropylmalate/(R)-2-methylmalate dehydratase small subunit
MVIKGKAWKFGDDISTDHIIPGRFYHLRSNLEELTKYVFDDIAPGFSRKITKGDVIVAGKNFGLGSSREHAPLTIKMAGIDAVVDIEEGDQLEISLDEGVLMDKTTGKEKHFSPLPAIMRDILNEGGLDHYIKKNGALKV